jgi:hypothetical protein
MPEPLSATASGAASVGFLALLVGALGPVAADVMLVVISALAGCFIALSGMKGQTIMQSVGFVVIGVSVSLVLAWGATNFVTSLVPQLNGPYTPAIIAMMIGFMGNQMPSIFSAIVAKIKGKAGI